MGTGEAATSRAVPLSDDSLSRQPGEVLTPAGSNRFSGLKCWPQAVQYEFRGREEEGLWSGRPQPTRDRVQIASVVQFDLGTPRRNGGGGGRPGG
jgi:hypothetical protein